MKIILDNCVPKRVRRLLPGHDVKHASQVGWSNLSNGRLLQTAADGGFDLMITVDKGIRHQHPLDRLPLPVLELFLDDTRFPSIQAVSAHLEQAVETSRLHRFLSLNASGVLLIVQQGPARR